MSDRCTIQSFDVRTLQVIRSDFPSFKTSLLIDSSNMASLDRQIEHLGFVPDVYSPDFSMVNADLVSACRDLEMEILPWTVNRRSEMNRLDELGVSGVHLHKGLGVVRQVGVHAIDDAKIIGMLAHFGKELRDAETALSVLAKFERGSEELGAGTDAVPGGSFPRVFGQLRFVVERIDVRWPPAHAKEDDSLRLRREMGLWKKRFRGGGFSMSQGGKG